MTLKAAVVGWPISHSLSPKIFSAFARSAQMPLQYAALEIEPGEFAGALRKACADGWVGWNVTLPHKLAARALSDRLDKSAREAGAVNVIRFQDGKRIGYNTDADGFLAPLKKRGFVSRGKRAVVLGAGGAARAVCAALRREKVADLRILNRTPEKARELALAFGGDAAQWTREELLIAIGRADLVVNATSLGLEGEGSPIHGGAKFKPGALAYDLIYNPRETPFLLAAKTSGAQTLGGLGMLVAQAAATWKIWFKKDLPIAAVENAEAALQEILE